MIETLTKSPELKSLIESPHLLKAEMCRRSFFFFVKEFWETIIAEEPVYNWHIPFLCVELEKIFIQVVNRLPKQYDLVVNIPPGTTKSTIVSQLFHPWCWIARNPLQPFREDEHGQIVDYTGADLRFISGSYASPLSLEHAEYSRDVIWSDKWRLYFPEVTIRPDKAVKSNFKNEQGGTRFSTSVGSTVTGVHAHIITIDDPLNPLQAVSDTQRQTASQWMDHTLSTRKVDKAVTVTILIMQRLHKHDPTGIMTNKKNKKVRHIVLPGTTEYSIKPKALKRFYVDGLLDPVRLSQTVCDEMKTDLGPYGYAGQVGQDPRPREGAMFQKEWFEIVSAAPAGGTDWVRGWDLAGTTEKEAKSNAPAYTAGVRMKSVGGVLYIGDARRFRASPNNVRVRMRNTSSQDPEGTIQDFPQDPGQAGKDQARNISAHLIGFIVRYSVESGDKVLRAEPFSSQCEAGNVKLVEGDWNEEFLEEVTFFPNGFKDSVDAVARAFNRITTLLKKGKGTVGPPTGTKNKKREQH